LGLVNIKGPLASRVITRSGQSGTPAAAVVQQARHLQSKPNFPGLG
jgi:hypothetical protein